MIRKNCEIEHDPQMIFEARLPDSHKYYPYTFTNRKSRKQARKDKKAFIRTWKKMHWIFSRVRFASPALGNEWKSDRKNNMDPEAGK